MKYNALSVDANWINKSFIVHIKYHFINGVTFSNVGDCFTVSPTQK